MSDGVANPSAVAGNWFDKSELIKTEISVVRQQDTDGGWDSEGRGSKHGEGSRGGDESDELRGESHYVQRGGGMVKDWVETLRIGGVFASCFLCSTVEQALQYSWRDCSPEKETCDDQTCGVNSELG